AQEFRDVPHRVRRQIALLLLDEIERREHRRFPAIGRVLAANLLELSNAIRRERERLPFGGDDPVRFVPALAVRPQRMEAAPSWAGRSGSPGCRTGRAA